MASKTKRLVKAQRGLCAICGRSLVWWKARLDHVHPKSKGGTLAYGNVVAVHHPCNWRKGARLPTAEEITLAQRMADRLGYAVAQLPWKEPHDAER